MKTITCILLFALLNTTVFSQKDDLKFGAFNVISSGIISGIGSGIHKHKGQNFGQAFVKGFWKGCIGGSLNYTGKKILEQSAINNTYAYVWPCKLVHSLGTSMVANGSRNENLLSSVEMDVFFTHLKYNGELQWQIDPLTLGSAIVLAVQKDYSFNWGVSGATGSMAFDKKSDDFIVDGGEIEDFKDSGQSFGNTIWRKICKQYFYTFSTHEEKIEGKIYTINTVQKSIVTWDKQIICHELVHNLQYAEFSNINAFYLDKINLSILNHIYINANFGAVYLLVNLNGYKNNYFENEATYFGESNFFTKNTN